MLHQVTRPVGSKELKHTHCTKEQYNALYQRSIESPEVFWAEQAADFLTWNTPWSSVCSGDFAMANAQWFVGGQLNLSVNCIDRYLPSKAEHIAFIWEGDNPQESRLINYQTLHDEVARLANELRAQGVKKGDRVCIYLPMILEATYAMLACARIGAIHSVVFGGFSPEALKDRILDSDCRLVITADEGVRGGRKVPLKANVDKALINCPEVYCCLVVKHTGANIDWVEGRDHWYHEQVSQQPAHCEPEIMEAEDPLFILYTSGSTGKPKGVLHSTAGYALQAAMTFKYVFDYQPGDVYWCTADVGWITGHTYLVYGPLLNGATSVIFEGVPTYPDAGRCWEVCDKHQVNIFYTAPTAIRALEGAGNGYVTKHQRDSLRILGTVGEPINIEAWEWYHDVVGNQQCPIIDTWWQTETGGHMLAPLPGATTLKAGSATLPFFGVEPALMDANGDEIIGEGEGALVMKRSWPGQIRTVYGDHKRCQETYFSAYSGYYFTGDGARRDEDGYYWITGRMDDVLNVSGHRMGTAEVENAIDEHEAINEAAVVGYPHDIKGQGVYAFVTIKDGYEVSDQLEQELKAICTREIGAIAKPDIIQVVQDLPKTRSGKIMRRILRKIACNELDSLGDTSTLSDPTVVQGIIATRHNI